MDPNFFLTRNYYFNKFLPKQQKKNSALLKTTLNIHLTKYGWRKGTSLPTVTPESLARQETVVVCLCLYSAVISLKHTTGTESGICVQVFPAVVKETQRSAMDAAVVKCDFSLVTWNLILGYLQNIPAVGGKIIFSLLRGCHICSEDGWMRN